MKMIAQGEPFAISVILCYHPYIRGKDERTN